MILKRLYRRTHAKLTRLAGSGQLVWAPGCEFSPALVQARRPAWPGETSETTLRVAPPRKTRPPDHTQVNWPVDASASGSAQVGPGGRHRWAARVQVGREPARQKAREGYPSHYTSLPWGNSIAGHQIATNFCPCHDSTDVLSCTNFVAITILKSRWEWNEISIELELRWKNRSWNGAQGVIVLLCEWAHFWGYFTHYRPSSEMRLYCRQLIHKNNNDNFQKVIDKILTNMVVHSIT